MCSAINRAIGEVALHFVYPLYGRVASPSTTARVKRIAVPEVASGWLEAETDLEPGVLLKLQFLIEF